MSNETKSNASKPFEWLSGGLFFGKSKDGIESVDSCKDVNLLLNGIKDNLTTVALSESIIVEKEDDTGARSESATDQAASAEKTEPSQSKFLASRLSRLRFLLYDERRITCSQQEYRKSTPIVAGATMLALTGQSLQHLVPKLVEHLAALPFESRKHVAAIFNYLLVCGLEGSDAELYLPIMVGFRDYVGANFDEIVTPIVRGHECATPGGASDVSLHCGSMYRSCFKHASLYRQLVSTSDRVKRYIFPFLDKFVHLPNFDVSSDAMESLRLVFTAGSDGQLAADEVSQREMAEMAAEFMTRDYEAIWDARFNPKLMSDQANYMTKRIALQILSTVLLTRSNYSVMIRYVNSRQNLILVMHVLRDNSPHITLDAFHVFKVFVANPSKIPEVVKILKDNKEKLCRYLETLHQDKEASDTQFRDEKALIIATIQGL
jgi:calcium binding protein 39